MNQQTSSKSKIREASFVTTHAYTTLTNFYETVRDVLCNADLFLRINNPNLIYSLRVVSLLVSCLRFPVASRPLEAGQLVMEERPLTWAPMLDTRPVCLSCLASLSQGPGLYLCPRCGWPMCEPRCAKAEVHRKNVRRTIDDPSVFSEKIVKPWPQTLSPQTP